MAGRSMPEVKMEFYMWRCDRLALSLGIISPTLSRVLLTHLRPPSLCPSVHIRAACSTAPPEATADFRCCLQTSPLLRPLGGRGGSPGLTDLTAAG